MKTALAQNFDQKAKHACSVEFGVLVDIASNSPGPCVIPWAFHEHCSFLKEI